MDRGQAIFRLTMDKSLTDADRSEIQKYLEHDTSLAKRNDGGGPKTKVMEEFTITEISAVDLPAQVGAKALVRKREEDQAALIKQVQQDLADEKAALIAEAQRALDEKERRLNEQISEKENAMSTDLMTKARKLASEENIPMTAAMIKARQADPSAYSKYKQAKTAEAPRTTRKASPAFDSLKAKALEIQKAEGGTLNDAMIKARRQSPALFKSARGPYGNFKG